MKGKKIKVIDIARDLEVSLPSVSQTIHSVIRSRRIRERISIAVNIPVDVLWPEDQGESDQKQDAP